MPFTYPYPRPSVTCDAVVFAMRANDLAVLLIRRKDDPFKGLWALPGGYVNDNESLDRAAARELSEETGLGNVRLEQLGAFGDPGRDPRGHTVTVAWLTFLMSEAAISAGDDASEAKWHAFRSLELDPLRPLAARAPAAVKKELLPRKKTAAVRTSAPASKTRSRTPQGIRLAFDHAKIIAKAYRRLCQHLDDPLRGERPFDLLPSRFTLTELQRVYEVVLGRPLASRAFRKRLLDHALVVPAAAKPTANAAAQLYRWNRR